MLEEANPRWSTTFSLAGTRILRCSTSRRTAWDVSRKRLGDVSDRVRWLIAHVTQEELPPARYDVWHDRGVFHFLTAIQGCVGYVRQVACAVKTAATRSSAPGPETPFLLNCPCICQRASPGGSRERLPQSESSGRSGSTRSFRAAVVRCRREELQSPPGGRRDQ